MTRRRVDLARLGLGVAALASPRALLPSEADTRWSRVFTRILGARYVLQSTAGLVHRRPWVPQVDAGVDLVHAATMLGLAALSQSHRRVALTSAATAVFFAVADLAEDER